MAVARKLIVNPQESHYYHCTVRCVRRAYLCGLDKVTGMNYDHRRKWIQNRLTYLLEVFAIDCFAYAVMSNHLHTVIRNNPEEANQWSNRQVAVRWRKLFSKFKDKTAYEEDIERISKDQQLVEKYRKRLSCISWFNRCMNENIAKRANQEDECTGRFWESRFRCQRLQSLKAVIACGIYVDLNPIRAKMADSPEDSAFTSIQDRIHQAIESEHGSVTAPAGEKTPRLMPITPQGQLSLTQKEYINLVDQAARITRAGKRGKVDETLAPILQRLGLNPDFFIENVLAKGNSLSTMFTHVLGDLEQVRGFAKSISQKFVHGTSSALLVFA